MEPANVHLRVHLRSDHAKYKALGWNSRERPSTADWYLIVVGCIHKLPTFSYDLLDAQVLQRSNERYLHLNRPDQAIVLQAVHSCQLRIEPYIKFCHGTRRFCGFQTDFGVSSRAMHHLCSPIDCGFLLKSNTALPWGVESNRNHRVNALVARVELHNT